VWLVAKAEHFELLRLRAPPHSLLQYCRDTAAFEERLAYPAPPARDSSGDVANVVRMNCASHWHQAVRTSPLFPSCINSTAVSECPPPAVRTSVPKLGLALRLLRSIRNPPISCD